MGYPWYQITLAGDGGKPVLWNGRGKDGVTHMTQGEVPIERVDHVSSES